MKRARIAENQGSFGLFGLSSQTARHAGGHWFKSSSAHSFQSQSMHETARACGFRAASPCCIHDTLLTHVRSRSGTVRYLSSEHNLLKKTIHLRSSVSEVPI